MRFKTIAIGLLLVAVSLLAWRAVSRDPAPRPSPDPSVAALSPAGPAAPAQMAGSASAPAPVAVAPAPPPPTAPDDVSPPSPPAPDRTTPEGRQAWAATLRATAERDLASARWMAEQAGLPPRGEVGESTYEFAAVRDGRVYVRTTRNENAAISAAVNLVRPPQAPGLTGSNLTVGVWDAGAVRATHQEFGGRVTLRNTMGAHTHSTHVGGTIAAAGVTASARGMAPAIRVDSYDWNFDTAEMLLAGRAATNEPHKLPLSNHSYGYQAGWYWSGSGHIWYGTWGLPEADGFGMYDVFAAELDEISVALPYYLIVKAAGNDRNDTSPSAGQTFTYFTPAGTATKTYDPATDPPSDNWDQGGYDTIPYESNAKNILTVGAVNDAVAGGTRSLANATMTTFTSWGPTDDGRVKPDLVANGVSLYSTTSFGDISYGHSSGTSMAAPNAMGAAALVVEYVERLFPGRPLRASTLKGLLIHTADDLGPDDGPDYRFGWGLINAHAAVQLLEAHHARPDAHRLVEASLVSGVTNRYVIHWDRTAPLRATLSWADPPGPVRTALDDRTPVLMHDLDLRLIGPGGEVHLPYTLDPAIPTAPAIPGDNIVDNVEQVRVAAPAAGPYTLAVSAKGVLASAQPYALLLSGVTQPPAIAHTPLVNTTNLADAHPVTAAVSSETALDPAGVRLHWRVHTPPDGGAFTPVVMSAAGDTFGASIPPQPLGSTIEYWIEAAATNGLVGFDPPGAPAALHRFAIVEAFTLFIGGAPLKVPGVDPSYGYHQFPSGVTVRATAPAHGPATDGVRYQNTGWLACCSLPPSGATNVLEFVMDGDAFVSWQWAPAYALTQSANVPGVVSAVTWWVDGSLGHTLAAPLEIEAGARRFASWFVDGVRWPGADTPAANPATAIPMQAPRAAEARYLPAAEDSNGNGLPDWWELYYFGALGVLPHMDADGDGFSNIKEFEDGTDPRDPDDVPMPPAIAHTPLATMQGTPAPWPVSAVVTDNHGVDRVTLEWRRNGGAWTNAPALPGEGSGVYTSAIPVGVTGDTLQYRLVARDLAGLMAVNGPYTLNVAYPLAAVSPADFGTLNVPAQNNQRVVLALQNTGHQNLLWTLQAESTGLWDDVEPGPGGWTTGGSTDIWHITNTRVYSGSNAWYMGNAVTRQYPDNCRAWLLSPPVYLEAGARFTYRQWLHTEPVKDADYAWDGGVVELSTDNGVTFEQITPEGGYPYLIFGHPAAAFPDGTPCFAGTGGWEQVAFDLSAYTGQTVRVRLRFGADGFVVGEGWYVDDLSVTPYGGPADWLGVNKSGGMIPSQSGDSVLVTANTHTLAPAETRRAVLRVSANDPIQPQHLTRIALHNTSRRLSVEVLGAGAVTPPGPVILPLGAATNFWVEADPYHHLGALLTNGTPVAGAAGRVATNLIWSTQGMTGNGVLRAEFVAKLTASGVPEWWLAGYGLTNAAFDIEAESDADGDGFTARQEFIAGTDPTDPASRLNIAALDPVLQLTDVGADAWRVLGHELAWASVSGRVYTVRHAADPRDVFLPLWTNLPATPPENRVTHPIPAAPAGFYQLDVTWPDAP